MAHLDRAGPDFLSAVPFFGDPGPYRGPVQSGPVSITTTTFHINYKGTVWV